MHEHDTDPLESLRTALDVTPSPAFAARVRGRVQAQGSRGVLNRWTLAAAAVAVAAAVWMGVRPGDPESAGPAAPTVAVAPAQPRVIEAPAVDEVVPAVQPAAGAPAARPRRTAALVSRDTNASLEVLVPPDQMAGLLQLRAAILEGRLDPSDLPPDRLGWDAPEAPVLGRPADHTEPPNSPLDDFEPPDGTRYSG